MAATNVTVRVDSDIKQQFDVFCESVGMNISTAINLYMRAVLRTRTLPFVVTDVVNVSQEDNQQFGLLLSNMRNKAAQMGFMSDEEINAARSEMAQM